MGLSDKDRAKKAVEACILIAELGADSKGVEFAWGAENWLNDKDTFRESFENHIRDFDAEKQTVFDLAYKLGVKAGELAKADGEDKATKDHVKAATSHVNRVFCHNKKTGGPEIEAKWCDFSDQVGKD